VVTTISEMDHFVCIFFEIGSKIELLTFQGSAATCLKYDNDITMLVADFVLFAAVKEL